MNAIVRRTVARTRFLPSRGFAAKAEPAASYYSLLDVGAKAPLSEIKANYYKLAKKYHPDALGEGVDQEVYKEHKEIFEEITEAYAILSDPALRKRYDRRMFGDHGATSTEF
mmetsp:Transcript_32475/g.49697  ORF Transcript_32475/g.49697 Transcript_32475/m.49697 type:complete len:112 (+) Transcript_32475:38-373(+)